MEAIELTIISESLLIKKSYEVDCNNERAFLWKYLDELHDKGIIEDYASKHAIEQFTNSYQFIYGSYSLGFKYCSYNLTADDIIKLVDKHLANKPNEYDFDNYDDYIDAIEEFDKNLVSTICDFRIDYRKKLDRLRSDFGEWSDTFYIADESTDARIYIPMSSKYFKYYYNIAHEYYNNMLATAFHEASKIYPFIGEF